MNTDGSSTEVAPTGGTSRVEERSVFICVHLRLKFAVFLMRAVPCIKIHTGSVCILPLQSRSRPRYFLVCFQGSSRPRRGCSSDHATSPALAVGAETGFQFRPA